MPLAAAVYPTNYSFNDTTISCLEDPGVALAPELLGNSSGGSAAAPGSDSNSSGPSSSHKATILGAVIGVVAACVLVTAIVTVLVVRRRRRRQRVQGTHDSKMNFMESGERPSPEVPLFARDGHMTPVPLDESANCSAAAKNALWRSK